MAARQATSSKSRCGGGWAPRPELRHHLLHALVSPEVEPYGFSARHASPAAPADTHGSASR